LTENFSWIPIYQELADQLAGWQGRQGELIAFLEKLRTEGYVITPLNDKDNDGARFLLKEIDPFTFFGVFNRGIRRINVLRSWQTSNVSSNSRATCLRISTASLFSTT